MEVPVGLATGSLTGYQPDSRRTLVQTISKLHPPSECARFLAVKGRVSNGSVARVRRIYLRLRGVRGVSEEERWQHALYFSKTPDERCRLSLQAARLALSLRRSGTKTSPAS